MPDLDLNKLMEMAQNAQSELQKATENLERLHPAGERPGVERLDDEVDVVADDGVLDDAEPLAAPEPRNRPLDHPQGAMGPERRQSVDHPQRHVQRKARREARPPPVRHPTTARPPGPRTPATPADRPPRRLQRQLHRSLSKHTHP